MGSSPSSSLHLPPYLPSLAPSTHFFTSMAPPFFTDAIQNFLCSQGMLPATKVDPESYDLEIEVEFEGWKGI